ncbi:MAG: RagB/SusD family nutrient uptake outer membrane protein [Ignavibacteria bacterium]|nr:RagB/SusD family nutrient uptake outer membrane protein [Ignavibacteria bacterium]
MKKNHVSALVGCLLAVALVVGACDSSFKAKDSTIISPDNVVGSGYPGATVMLLGSWVRLVNVMDDVSQMPEVATDNVDETDSFQSSADFDRGVWHPGLLEINVVYSGLHDARKQADLFLTEYLDAFDLNVQYPTTAGTPPMATRKNTFRAYATLIRGWATLYLGLLFDEVNFDQGQRVSAQAAIDRAIQDLSEVEAMYGLPSNAPETRWNSLNIRKAANTLLAKAYLQSGKFAEALVASGKGLLKSDTQADRSVLAAYEQAAGSGPGTGSNVLFSTSAVANSTNPNKRFSMNKFFIVEDPKDNRVNLDSATTGGQRFVQFGGNDRNIDQGYVLDFTAPRVLRKMASTTLAGSFIRILSWQDNTLMSAEAKIRSGNIGGGIADINTIRSDVRTDAGQPVLLASATDLQSAMVALEYEIRMELCGEVGHYFIALRRWDQNHHVNPGKKYTLPIPSTE